MVQLVFNFFLVSYWRLLAIINLDYKLYVKKSYEKFRYLPVFWRNYEEFVQKLVSRFEEQFFENFQETWKILEKLRNIWKYLTKIVKSSWKFIVKTVSEKLWKI